MKKSIFVFLCLFLGIDVYPQQINISGTVLDNNSSPISNVLVKLSNHPDVTSVTNASGEFLLYHVSTAEKSLTEENEFTLNNGLLLFREVNQPISVQLYNLYGQQIKAFHTANGSSNTEIDLRPFLRDYNVYILRIIIAEKNYGIKFFKQEDKIFIQEKGAYIDKHKSLKNTNTTIDTIILTHNQYVLRKVPVSSYTSSIGTITLLKVNVPTITAPSNATGSFTVTMSYDWNPMLMSSSDRYELEESTTSATSGFAKIEGTNYGERPTTYQVTLIRASGIYYYRARVYDRTAFSEYSNVISVDVTAPVTPLAPSNLTVEAEDPKTVKLKWSDNSNNETGFEIQRETSAGSNQYATIFTTNPNITYYSDNNLISTSCSYRIRAKNGNTGSNWSQTAFAPPKLRVVNNLYNGITVYNGIETNWGIINCIVRVRIGPTENSVKNSSSYEKLEPKESSYSYTVNYINPGYNSTPDFLTSEDFDISAYGYGSTYYVFIQCGYWEYDASLSFSWIKNVTNVLCTNGNCCCEKWSIINVTSHNSGYFVLNAAEFLPQRHWNGM